MNKRTCLYFPIRVRDAEKKPDPAARLRSTFTSSALKIVQINSIVCMKIFVTPNLSTGTPNARTRRACGMAMIKKLEHVHQLHLPVHQRAQDFPVNVQAVSFPITARKGLSPLAASGTHSRIVCFCVRFDAGSIRKRSREACFKSLGFLNKLTRDPQTSSGSKLIRSKFRMCVLEIIRAIRSILRSDFVLLSYRLDPRALLQIIR